MGWVSPTSHVDPTGQWFDEIKMYDDDEDTYGWCNTICTYSGKIRLLHASLSCSKVRILLGHTDTVIIDVYYNGDWHEVCNQELSAGSYHEFELGDTYDVTEARTCRTSEAGNYFLKEFDFWEVPAIKAKTSIVPLMRILDLI